MIVGLSAEVLAHPGKKYRPAAMRIHTREGALMQARVMAQEGGGEDIAKEEEG